MNHTIYSVRISGGWLLAEETCFDCGDPVHEYDYMTPCGETYCPDCVMTEHSEPLPNIKPTGERS